GTLIHASCKKTYVSRVKRLVPYRPTKHNYRISFTNNTNITKCSVKNNFEFINLVDFGTILSGNLNHNFLVGKLQITNAFETSKLMMNPALPEVAEFMNVLPDDGLALTIVETANDDKMVKKKEYWSNLQQKTIEEVSIIHSNSDENSKISTIPSSKHSSDELESLPDLSLTSKKLCMKTITQENIDGKLPATGKEIVVIKREKNDVEKKIKNGDSQTILAGTKEKRRRNWFFLEF
ncbi:unnamed protein product, partial [Thlaspi arvense]